MSKFKLDNEETETEGLLYDNIQETNSNILQKIVEESYNNKTIIFSNSITSNTIYSLFHPLKYLVELEDSKPIHLYINTDGGSAPEALFLSSYIQSSPVPIYTYGMGQICSGGAIILFSGHKRFCYKYTTIMFHLPSGDLERATSKHLEHRLKSLKMMDNCVIDLMRNKTKISQEDLDSKLDLDWYLTAEECLSYGFIDEIL